MSVNIIHLVSNDCWGGGERYALDLCIASRRAGHSVAVVTRGYKDVDAPFAANDITVGKLPLRGWYDLFSHLQLARILNRINDTTVLHVHNFQDARTAVLARRLSRKPENTRIVLTRHLAKAAKTGKSDIALYKALDAIVFVSETARKAFWATNPDLEGCNIHTVRNSLLELPQVVEQHTAGSELNILYAGRIHPEKGLDVLIRALAKVEFPYRLTVAGTGPSREAMALVRLARKYGVDSRCDWKGYVDDLAPLMEQADVCVVPSTAPEAFGFSLLEFMAAGLPVVASDSGAQTELVENGVDGLLFEAGNADALAAALTRLNDDAALRAALGAAAARKVRDSFDYNDFYKQIDNIYSVSNYDEKK